MLKHASAIVTLADVGPEVSGLARCQRQRLAVDRELNELLVAPGFTNENVRRALELIVLWSNDEITVEPRAYGLVRDVEERASSVWIGLDRNGTTLVRRIPCAGVGTNDANGARDHVEDLTQDHVASRVGDGPLVPLDVEL